MSYRLPPPPGSAENPRVSPQLQVERPQENFSDSQGLSTAAGGALVNSIMSVLTSHTHEIRACLDQQFRRQDQCLRSAIADLNSILLDHLPPSTSRAVGTKANGNSSDFRAPHRDCVMPSQPHTLSIGVKCDTDLNYETQRSSSTIDPSIGMSDIMFANGRSDTCFRPSQAAVFVGRGSARHSQAITPKPMTKKSAENLVASICGSHDGHMQPRLSVASICGSHDDHNQPRLSVKDLLQEIAQNKTAPQFGRYCLSETEVLEEQLDIDDAQRSSPSHLVKAKVKTQNKIVKGLNRRLTQSQSARSKSSLGRLNSKLVGCCLCTYLRRCRLWLRPLLANVWFEACVFVMIGSNAIAVGLEANHMVQNQGEEEPIYVYIDWIHTTLFTLELFLRMFAEGGQFFNRKNLSWNLFDCFIVASSILDSATSILVATRPDWNVSHFRLVRAFRMVKYLRSLRMVRLVRFIPAFRQLAHTLVVTVRALVWPLILLTMVLYGFSVTLTFAVAHHYTDRDIDIGRHGDRDMKLYFGSLPKAMRTLYFSITSGVDWGDVIRPLEELDHAELWVTLYFVYITFTTFAICNAITGVFCQCAIETAQMDKDMLAASMLANKDVYTRTLQEMFQEFDFEHDGEATLGEFEAYLADHPQAEAYLQSLEISTHDVWSLFRILDSDEEGTLDAEEFVEGCLNIKGPAKAMQVVKLERELRALRSLVNLRVEELG